jgi:hypothetical protein
VFCLFAVTQNSSLTSASFKDCYKLDWPMPENVEVEVEEIDFDSQVYKLVNLLFSNIHFICY